MKIFSVFLLFLGILRSEKRNNIKLFVVITMFFAGFAISCSVGGVKKNSKTSSLAISRQAKTRQAKKVKQKLKVQTKTIKFMTGKGKNQIGVRKAGKEHLAFGPQSFTLSRTGEPVILDSVNQRVLFFNKLGKEIKRIAINQLSSDLCVAPDKTVYVINLANMIVTRYNARENKTTEFFLPAGFKTLTGIDWIKDEAVIKTYHEETYSLETKPIFVSKKEGVKGFDGRYLLLKLKKSEKLGKQAMKNTDFSILQAQSPKFHGKSKINKIFSAQSSCTSVKLLGSLQTSDIAIVCENVEQIGKIISVQKKVLIYNNRGQNIYSFNVPTSSNFLIFRQLRIFPNAIAFLTLSEESIILTIKKFSR